MDKKGREYLARMAELFDLPGDLVAMQSRIELLGDRQLYLEGHGGILAYATDEIDVALSFGVLRVHGAGLLLRAMTEDEVRIAGRIDSLELLHQGRG